MDSIVAIVGPRDAGPGERHVMLDQAHELLAGIDDVTRVDVPGRGTSGDGDGHALRHEVQVLVPALQSGSLFGGASGVLVVDAQALLSAEAEVLAELLRAADPTQVTAVFIAAGTLPAALAKAIKDVGATTRIKPLTENDASKWLVAAARERRITLHGDAVSALISRFGSDVAALDQALDQLESSGDEVTVDMILARFKNRPDEPMWHYADAVAGGDVGEALRRLEDFLLHGHPLQLVAYLGGDVRKRALAHSSPDLATFAGRAGMKAESYPARKVWQQRSRIRAEDLQKALDAIARTDLNLKTMPEPTHRLNMERLTVALCRWYGGRSR